MLFIRYCRAQIAEIQSSLPAQVLGCGLALTHIVTYFFWFTSGRYILATSKIWDPICWPFFSQCADWPRLEATSLQLLGRFYLALAAGAALAFFFRRTAGLACLLLLLLTSFKLYVFYQDYRFMGNYHFMAFLTTLLYLFLPHKSWGARRLIVGFYVAAGVLKINHEWLQGLAFPNQWIRSGTPPAWLFDHGLGPLSCAYVVILEMIISFGLLSSNVFVFWSCFVQFLIFHIFSYWIVGWYYPLIMACLLAVFPAHLYASATLENPALTRRPAAIFLIIFMGLQAWPMLLPGDAALTGQGRMLALNMFDSLSHCYSKSLARFDKKTVDVTVQPEDFANGVRIQCDPYVYYQRAKRLCAQLVKSDPSLQGISLYLQARRSSEGQFRTVVAIENICDKSIRYNWLWANEWIQE